jgi:hypothetical protein
LRVVIYVPIGRSEREADIVFAVKTFLLQDADCKEHTVAWLHFEMSQMDACCLSHLLAGLSVMNALGQYMQASDSKHQE